MLATIENTERIAQAQHAFENIIREAATETRVITLGFQGGSLEVPVHYLAPHDIWVGISDLGNRYWNALGTGNPFSEPHSIIVEINPPKGGIDRRVSGIFLRDESEQIHLAHRGRVGGGRKGIGKNTFLDWYPGPIQPIADGHRTSQAIVIGALAAPNLPDRLSAFVRRVEQFKEQASNPAGLGKTTMPTGSPVTPRFSHPEAAVESDVITTATDCPFCHPDADRVFLETEFVIGLWDKYPVTPGHALIVPRRHVADWFEATAEERHALMDALEPARAEILKNHQPDGFNIGINLGRTAGQTVFHLHVHLIPRHAGDHSDPAGGIRAVIPERARYR